MRDLNREEPPGRRAALAAAAVLAALLAAALALAAAARQPAAVRDGAQEGAGARQEEPAGGGDAAARGAGQPDEGPDRPAAEAPGDAASGGGDEGAASPEASPGRDWALSLEGGQALSGYSDAQLDALEDGVVGWLDEAGQSTPGLVEVAGGPQDVDDDEAVTTRVWLRLANSRTYLQADWFEAAGRWRVAKVTGTVEGLNDVAQVVTGAFGEVELTDHASLAALLGQDASEALLAAMGERYGRGGAPGAAYVLPGEVARTGAGLSLVVHYAMADGAGDPVTVQTEASWDAAAGAWSMEDVPLG